MCGIAGWMCLEKLKLLNMHTLDQAQVFSALDSVLYKVFKNTSERGSDSWGLVGYDVEGSFNQKLQTGDFVRYESTKIATMFNKPLLSGIANFRGEPTTEVVDRSDFNIQPFSYASDGKHRCSVVHNGLICNDKEILDRGDVEYYLRKSGHKGPIVDTWAILQAAVYSGTRDNLFERIEGSYALAILQSTGDLLLARNYRDLAVIKYKAFGVEFLLFASKPQYLPTEDPIFHPVNSLPPYSYLWVNPNGNIDYGTIPSVDNSKRAVVVISGGLDSTTSAELACKDCDEVMLLHILYQCKAESQEEKAVKRICEELSLKYPDKKITMNFFETDIFKKLGGSTIVDESMYDSIAEGELGVETSSEWVPARNTVLCAIAAAVCDRYDIGRIYLGLNMEESGAFEDNTTEFYERMNTVLTIGTKSRAVIVNPLGNLMKHQIVKLAHLSGAPIHLSWSCYHGGELHCGKCGPCYMRLKAHMMNGLQESINYLEYPSWFPDNLK